MIPPCADEQARLLRMDMERRRKLRLQQVRQQERDFASATRTEFKSRQMKKISEVTSQIQTVWQHAKQHEKHSLEQLYGECLQYFGQSYASAQLYDEEALEQNAKHKQLRNELAARERFQAAIDSMHEKNATQQQEEFRRREQTLLARDIEKERREKILEQARAKAAAPPPAPITRVSPHDRVVSIRLQQELGLQHYASTAYHRETVGSLKFTILCCQQPPQRQAPKSLINQVPSTSMANAVDAAQIEQSKRETDAQVGLRSSLTVRS